jgi:hypothetical protein
MPFLKYTDLIYNIRINPISESAWIFLDSLNNDKTGIPLVRNTWLTYLEMNILKIKLIPTLLKVIE